MAFNPNVVTANNFYAFGADNTGVGACETKLQTLVDQVTTLGGGTIYVSRGTYSFPAGGVIWKSNVDLLFEEGAVFNLGDAATAPLIYGTPSNCKFTNVSVKGTWDVNPRDTGFRAFEIQGGTNITFQDCSIDAMNQMSLTCLNATNVLITGCKITRSARDCINLEDSTNVIVFGNTIQYGGDNGIACSFLSLTPAHTSIIIANNILEDTFGINCLGGKHIVISGNTMKRSKGRAIEVAYEPSFTEGATTVAGLNITNNQIFDIIKGSYVGSSPVAQYIYILGFAQKGGLSTEVFRPSNNASGNKVPQPPYGGMSSVSGGSYDYNSGHSSTATTVSGGHAINISNNSCIRTLQGGVTPSTWGFNSLGLFSTSGWVNTTISTDDLNGTALVLVPEVKHSIISNNIFMPGVIGILFPVTGAVDFSYEGLEIVGNKIFNCPSGGIVTDAGSALSVDIRILNNTINCDPYFTSTNRTGQPNGPFNGTWSNSAVPACLEISNLVGVHVGGNHFWNAAIAIHAAGAAVTEFSGTNWQHCNPTSSGYNAANAGIGNLNLSAPNSVGYVVEDCSPASATYGKILNYAPTMTASGSPPSTGKHIQGWVCWVQNPAPAAGKTLNYYYRATTGSANVSGTDWVPGYTTTT